MSKKRRFLRGLGVRVHKRTFLLLWFLKYAAESQSAGVTLDALEAAITPQAIRAFFRLYAVLAQSMTVLAVGIFVGVEPQKKG